MQAWMPPDEHRDIEQKALAAFYSIKEAGYV